MGSRNSMPASSAICARRKLFCHEASQRSGTLVTAMPLEQFGEKIPSFNLSPLNMVVRGRVCVEDIYPSFFIEANEGGLYARGNRKRAFLQRFWLDWRRRRSEKAACST